MKKIEHKKKLKQKQNKRAYAKRRKAQLDERNKRGDEWGYYSVYLTKDQKGSGLSAHHGGKPMLIRYSQNLLKKIETK